MNTIKKLSLSLVLISGLVADCSAVQFARKLWQKTPVVLLTGAALTMLKLANSTEEVLRENATIWINSREGSILNSEQQKQLAEEAFRTRGIKNLKIVTDESPYSIRILKENPTISLPRETQLLLFTPYEKFCNLNLKKFSSEYLTKCFDENYQELLADREYYNEQSLIAKFILGHELTHLQHPEITDFQNILKALIPLSLGAGWQIARTYKRGRIVSSIASLITGSIFYYFFTTYLQNKEKEADLGASNDPKVLRAGARWFQKISDKNPDYTPHTHPHPLERARYLNELADKLEKEQKETSQ